MKRRFGKLTTKTCDCIRRGRRVHGDDAKFGVFICDQIQSRLCVVNYDLRKASQLVNADVTGDLGQMRVQAGNCWACPHRMTELPRREKITTRNLIYHVCPLKANEHWRSNVAKIKEHAGLFNGRRIVAVAIGPQTHEPAEVRREFAGMACEWLDLPNDSVLRERATFLPLVLSVANENKHEATFYAHAKGIATTDTSDHVMPDDVRVRGSVRWRNAMYHHLLTRSPEVMRRLRRYACVGTTQIACAGLEPWKWASGMRFGYWHFAGTFFWFRHDVVFTRTNWRQIPCDHYGVEGWLGGIVPISESSSMLQPWDRYSPPDRCMYEPDSYGSEFDE